MNQWIDSLILLTVLTSPVQVFSNLARTRIFLNKFSSFHCQTSYILKPILLIVHNLSLKSNLKFAKNKINLRAIKIRHSISGTCYVPEVLIYIFHEDSHQRLVISQLLNFTNIIILNLSTGLIKFNYHYLLQT